VCHNTDRHTMGFPMNKLIFVIALLLTACGGGGGGQATNPTQAISTCTLKSYTPTYPSSYQGSNSIPTPNSKFDNNLMRGIGVKDYYPSDNNGCATSQEHTRLLFS